MKLVIVGGVAGGASAAARARRLDETAQIVLLERGPDISFANCGLPYHIGGEITDRSKLLVTTPERLRERFRIDVRTRSNVIKIDRKAKTVRVHDLETGREYDEAYDKLILSPGAAPIRPNLPGIDLPGIYTLRNLEDLDRIMDRLRANVDRAVVIGAGYIGLEVTENLVKRGIETSLVELADQVMPPLDPEMTAPIVETLIRHGVSLHLSESAESFETVEGTGPNGVGVKLKSGLMVAADLVLIGVGVRPDTALAAEAGLELNPRGGIRVNQHMVTSDPDILAVGDAVEVIDFVTGQPSQIPLAGPANRQGRIAADVVFGRMSRYRGTQGTSIVRVFDKCAGCTGASEKLLKRLGRPYLTAVVHPLNHAGYFPGAETMTLKITYEPETGKLLGAQAVGGAGVDKRIDVLAMAIQAGMTVFDLEEAELAYAPQFGSAKDPVNMVGFVAAGRLRGEHPQISLDQLEAELNATHTAPFLLDVRTPAEFALGSIPGAVNIPIDVLRDRLAEVPADHPIVAYCQVGIRGLLATRILNQHGRTAVNLSGGYTSYAQRRTVRDAIKRPI